MDCKFDRRSVNEKTAESSIVLPNSTGRLLDLGLSKRYTPVLNRHTLRDDQIHLIFAICRSCKDSDGNNITEYDARIIVAEHFGYPIGPFGVYLNLKNPEHPLTINVANVIQPHMAFFEEKARRLHVECSKAGKLKHPALLPPPTTET